MKLPLALFLVAATTLPFVGAGVVVQASEQQDEYWQQLAECTMLLLTDPLKQAEVCGSRDGPSGRTLPPVTFPDPEPSYYPSSIVQIDG